MVYMANGSGLYALLGFELTVATLNALSNRLCENFLVVGFVGPSMTLTFFFLAIVLGRTSYVDGFSEWWNVA